MLDLYFEPMFTNLRFCNAMDLKVIDELSVALNETDSPQIEEAWDSLQKFFSEQLPGWNETLKNMKSDLFMSLYATLFYTTVSSTSKNEIARQISPVIGLDLKDCEKTLDRSCQGLRDKYMNANGELCWNQSRKNNNLFYFQPFWTPFSVNRQLKGFDEKDLYLYITHYQDWPFFLNNENGMLLCDYHKAVKELNDKILETSKTGISEQLSFFVFEQLFSPCRLSNLLTSFCDVFEKSFYDIDSPTRERAIVFSSALSSLPVNLQKNYLKNYLDSLNKYLCDPNNVSDKNNFEQQLSYAIYCSSYIFPLAQSILLYFIFCAYVKREVLQNMRHCATLFFSNKSLFTCYAEKPLYPELIFSNNLPYLLRYAFDENMLYLKTLKAELETYITNHIEEFDYRSLTQQAYKQLSSWHYPVKKDSKTSKTHNLSEKLRNNVPIESFDYNFTYNFFSNGALFHYFDRCQSGNMILPQNYNSELCTMFFNLANNICNIYTANFIQKKNPRLLTFGTIG